MNNVINMLWCKTKKKKKKSLTLNVEFEDDTTQPECAEGVTEKHARLKRILRQPTSRIKRNRNARLGAQREHKSNAETSGRSGESDRHLTKGMLFRFMADGCNPAVQMQPNNTPSTYDTNARPRGARSGTIYI